MINSSEMDPFGQYTGNIPRAFESAAPRAANSCRAVRRRDGSSAFLATNVLAGIPHPDWAADAQERNTGWGGLQFHPTDMAKKGNFILRHGVWEGRQILSQAWIAAATQPQPIGSPYGCGWWVGGNIAPFAFAAGGRGNQAIAADPAGDLVVAMSAEIDPPWIG